MPSNTSSRLLVGLSILAALALEAAIIANRPGPASANPAGGFATIASGGPDTCAVTVVGGVKCWGDNSFGELGDGTYDARPIPGDVSGLTAGVTSVSGGEDTNCAPTSTGSVKCWGFVSTTPVLIPALSGGATAVSVASDYACAIRGGALSCWNFWGNVTSLSSGVTAVAAGTAHMCVVTGAGAVKCLGDNAQGQLGNGTTLPSITPVDVSGLGSGVVAVGAGNQYSCALIGGGTVKCWGFGYGATPVSVPGFSGVTAISVGGLHACGLTAAGGLKCWGSNTLGQLGDGQQCGLYCATPVGVAGLASGVAGVSAGLGHTCAVTTSGGALCWGDNTWGQLGNGTHSLAPGVIPNTSTTPVAVVQSVPKPTVTPTCPASGCSTPTVTPTPCPSGKVRAGTGCATPTPTPPNGVLPGLDFSIGVGTQCDSTSGPSKCNFHLGDAFPLDFKLDGIPAGLSYAGYDYLINYYPAGVISVNPLSLVQQGAGAWPSCAFAASDFTYPGEVALGCLVGVNVQGSGYTGVMAHLDLSCEAPGTTTIKLAHDLGLTDLVTYNLSSYTEAADESLTIDCLAPQPYPIDTDGDGCPDAKEAQTAAGSERAGGLRDFLNPWDYFNPSGDHQNRVDDVLAVVGHYGQDAGSAGYDAKYDRTTVGPNPWNLGPPDGKIRLADVFAILNQYGHDCD